MLGNIIWICPLAPGTSADVLIWDGYGPSRTRGDFFDFEVGGHDGAYKGRNHVIVPFIGRKNGTLTAANNVTMTCTGGIGHALSSCLLGCSTQDEAEDEAEVCVLCCQKRSTIAVYDEWKEHYCTVVVQEGFPAPPARPCQPPQGPTEPHAGRSMFLLSSGGAGGGVLPSGL